MRQEVARQDERQQKQSAPQPVAKAAQAVEETAESAAESKPKRGLFGQVGRSMRHGRAHSLLMQADGHAFEPEVPCALG